MPKIPVLYMIIPCYNEHEVLLDSAAKLRKKLETLIHSRSQEPAA
jgi:hypothetical protein